MNKRRISEIYLKLVEMNRDAFADGEYDVAYHVLLLALRCGQRLADLEYVTEVERLAEKESRYLDDHHPESVYSHKFAVGRGDIGIFRMAVQKAKGILRKIEAGR